MIYAKIDVDIIDHPRGTAAGREARDLWVWSILFSRKHQTNGVITAASVAESTWGAGGKKNIPLAERLVSAGLWGVHEDGFIVLRYAEKNDTKEAIEERREAERVRKAAQRGRGRPSGVLPLSHRDTRGRPADFPGSPSHSLSGTRSDPQIEIASGALSAPSVVIDDALRAWAGMAGAPEPTEQHLAEFLLDAAKHGKVFADHTAAFKSWMLKQKRFDSDRRERLASSNGRNVVQSAANRAWTPPKEMP